MSKNNKKDTEQCTLHSVSRFYVRVDKVTDKKLRYNGCCSKCNKDTDHRFDGGTLTENRFRCIKCKTINNGEFK